jgi:uncharacterized membrane protein YebE (DUF533 family)
MINAKSILDQVLGGLNQMAGEVTGPGGVKGMADKAKDKWDDQSTLTKGALAGGLLGLLLTGGGRRAIGTGVKVGGAAVVGGLAYKAYMDWKSGKLASASDDTSLALPNPEGTAFQPADAVQADGLSAKILAAMIAAAKADGHVTVEERARIDQGLGHLGLGDSANTMIKAELDQPLDVGRIAGLAVGEQEATQIYAASLLVVDPQAPAEKAYLANLAAQLKLDPGLVDHLHAKAAQLA